MAVADTILAFVIIIGLVLAIWAKISQQTIVELLKDIRDMGRDKSEEALEPAMDIAP